MAVKDLARRAFRGSPKGQKGLVTVPMSFESNEQGAVKVFFPMSVKITAIASQVTKAIASTNDGTITGANADGSSTGGVVTHTASDAIGTDGDGPVVPTTNNTVAAGSYYQLTSAKSTAGGKTLVTLEYITR